MRGGRLWGWKWLQDPAGELARFLMRNPNHSKKKKWEQGALRVYVCICTYLLVCTGLFRRSEQLTFFSFSSSLERTCRIECLESTQGTAVFMLNWLFESLSSDAARVTNYRWELSTLSHAFRFCLAFPRELMSLESQGYMATSFWMFFP